MSYLALARKWRPRVFADVMGQGHVVKALSHALDGDKLHPAILLTGTRGVGKTTLARIIAKGLNCETGVSSQPCGSCSACKEVDSGRFVDLLEIDAASNTGVDNVRELIDNSQYSPARGRYKVYLIDEVHMLSKSAFNALLKTLEEPPSHVKFILATTDPQKLPITVLSRCLQFNLKRLPIVVIRDQLAKVLDNEGVAYELAAALEIARSADGSMRDGLSLLDQAIAFAGGEALKREPVAEMLGTGSRQMLVELLQALAKSDGALMLVALKKLESQSPDYASLLNDVAASLQRIAVLQLLPDARDDDDDADIVALAGEMTVEDVQLWYQIAVNGRRDLPWAPDPRLGFEMSLLRMLAFKPDEAAAGGSAPKAPAGGARPIPAAGAGGGLRGAPAEMATAPVVAAPVDATPEREFAAPAVDPSNLPWAELHEQLGLEGATRQLARQCAWVSREDNRVLLYLSPDAAFLLVEARRAALEAALSRAYGERIELRIQLRMADEPAAESAAGISPAELDARRAVEKVKAAQVAIETDPVVRAFREQFGASVRPGSIQPLDS
jgi:DNA polymerase-3 subunit gamma/tau